MKAGLEARLEARLEVGMKAGLEARLEVGLAAGLAIGSGARLEAGLEAGLWIGLVLLLRAAPAPYLCRSSSLFRHNWNMIRDNPGPPEARAVIITYMSLCATLVLSWQQV